MPLSLTSRNDNYGEGILRPGALLHIRQLQLLEFIQIGEVLSARLLNTVPGIDHIPILYTDQPNNLWRARYRELADAEAERLTETLGSYVPPRYIELGPHADGISIYHEAVHAKRAQLGRSMLPQHAEPSAERAERFAATLESNPIADQRS